MKTKNIFAGIAATVILLIASVPAFGQLISSTIATASATIITPIEINPATDLSFGNLAVNTAGGSVVVDVASGSMVRTRTGGVSLPSTSAATTAATFTVNGQANYLYNITINPSSVLLSNGTSTMSAGSFTSYPAATGTLNATGTQTVLVGGVLTVGGSQALGIYTSTAPVTVTVSYQ